MTQLADGLAPAKGISRANTRDFVALTKPRITLMVVTTTAGGLFLAHRALGLDAPALTVFLTLFGTALIVAGANANRVTTSLISARWSRDRGSSPW